jgi:hypothetical protein
MAAIALIVLAAVLWDSRVTPPDAARLARMASLAVVTPPRPSPAAMRGAADDRSYARGLEAYASGRWGSAIASLSRVDRDDARFYCAVAELMQGNGEAAELLLRAVEDGRAEFYAREAAFYRVKAALARQDLPAARGLITEAVRIGAGPPGEAAHLRDELEVLR